MSQKMMKAGVLEPSEHFAVQEWPIPVPSDDEILLRVHACGVCQSEVSWWKLGANAKNYPFDENVLDWEIAQRQKTPGTSSRTYPALMGHEPSGEILAVGKNVTNLKPGMHAVALGNRSFAEYGVYPAAFVHPLQPSTPFEQALGEPIACVYNAAQRANVRAGDKVVLLGCGFMGLMLLQIMKRANPAVIVAIDVRDDALAVASKLGADVIANSAREDVVEAVRKAVGSKGATIVVEAIGKQVGLDIATQLVCWNGRIAIVGYHQGEPRRIDVGMWNVKGIDVVNAHERHIHIYYRGMVGGITLLEEGKLDMKALVTHTYPLDRIDDAFHQSADKPQGFIKAVVIP